MESKNHAAVDHFMAEIAPELQSNDIRRLDLWVLWGEEVVRNRYDVKQMADYLRDRWVGGSIAPQTFRNMTSLAVRLVLKFKSADGVDDAVNAYNNERMDAGGRATFSLDHLAKNLAPTAESARKPRKGSRVKTVQTIPTTAAALSPVVREMPDADALKLLQVLCERFDMAVPMRVLNGARESATTATTSAAQSVKNGRRGKRAA